jgi:hypothetical protein
MTLAPPNDGPLRSSLSPRPACKTFGLGGLPFYLQAAKKEGGNRSQMLAVATSQRVTSRHTLLKGCVTFCAVTRGHIVTFCDVLCRPHIGRM